MNRLTTTSKFYAKSGIDQYTLKHSCGVTSETVCSKTVCKERCIKNSGCDCCDNEVHQAIDRLAEYENTGLTPEEVNALKADNN